MTTTRYDLGDMVRLDANFYSDAALVTHADPTAVVLRVRKPDGTLTPYTYGVGSTIVKDATGVYHALVTIDQSGHWYYRWEGTGTIVTAEDDQFWVPLSPVFGRRR